MRRSTSGHGADSCREPRSQSDSASGAPDVSKAQEPGMGKGVRRPEGVGLRRHAEAFVPDPGVVKSP